MLVPWTPLAPSRRERLLRRLGQALAALAALALAIAAFQSDELNLAPLLGALVATAACLAATLSRPLPALELGVDAGGALAVRRAGDPDDFPEQGLQCVFAAPWLITLRRGTMWVRIWPDSLPGNAFRRFWVHVRWNPGRQPADRTAAAASVRTG